MKWLMIAAMASMLPSAAAAQDCLEQVEALAARLGLSTELPQAGPEAPSNPAPEAQPPTDLSQSGGVIAPPDTGGDMPTYEPPDEGDSDMPTAPEHRAPAARPGRRARRAIGQGCADPVPADRGAAGRSIRQ